MASAGPLVDLVEDRRLEDHPPDASPIREGNYTFRRDLFALSDGLEQERVGFCLGPLQVNIGPVVQRVYVV